MQNGFQDTKEVFQVLNEKQKEIESNWLDQFPIGGSLISFATHIKDTAIGESPVFFLLTEKNAEKEGEIINDGFDLIKKSMAPVVSAIDIDKTDIGNNIVADKQESHKIDNGKILQFIFPVEEIDEWKDLGLWTMSYSSVVVSEEGQPKNLADLYYAVQNIKNGPSKQCESLFEPQKNLEEEQESKLKRKHSLAFQERRCLWEEVNGKPAPMTYRLQARLPFNVRAVQDWMEKHPPIEKSLSFASEKDQEKLQKGLEVIAKRFLAFVSGQIEFKDKKWVMTGKKDTQQWKKLQEIYPYFKDKKIPTFQASELDAQSLKTEKKPWNSSARLDKETKQELNRKSKYNF